MLIPTDVKQKCDVLNCKNAAAAYFAVKGRGQRCYLCADCIAALASDLNRRTTPKSPKNTIKRLSDERDKR